MRGSLLHTIAVHQRNLAIVKLEIDCQHFLQKFRCQYAESEVVLVDTR